MIAALGAILVVGAAVWVWMWRARARGAQGELRVEWRPPATLGAGVTAREGRVARPVPWRLVDISVDLALAELRVARAAARGGRLFEMVPAGAVAAVNGGYFDERFRPVGWLVDHGSELAPRVARSSGGALAVRGSTLYIGPVKEVPFPPEFAVQNGPRLVETGGRIGIRADDGKRAARTVACDAEQRLHLIVVLARPLEGPTLHETARLLLGLGCRTALNLDGGPSSGVWLPPSAGLQPTEPAAPIAYAIAVTPR